MQQKVIIESAFSMGKGLVIVVDFPLNIKNLLLDESEVWTHIYIKIGDGYVKIEESKIVPSFVTPDFNMPQLGCLVEGISKGEVKNYIGTETIIVDKSEIRDEKLTDIFNVK